MKKITLFLILSLYILNAYTQDSLANRPPDFAIVDFSTNHGGNEYVCVVEYSDGKHFSLDKTLKMSTKEGHIITKSDMDAQEFKFLSYFYKNGYELLCITHESSNFLESPYALPHEPCTRYRFKLKQK